MRYGFAFRCQCVATATAKRRPPLFVGVRLCISKIVFSPANVRTATQERGASAPRGYATVIAMTFTSPSVTVSRDLAVLPLQVRFRTPRRAYARRSLWACVCASQKSLFRRQTSALQHKSGGRQPPVVTINTNVTATRTYTVGGPANNCACVCANVFPHPRRAHARRS